MKKKTLMAPKRMSARPSRSRGDAQIDARSYLLRDGVRFRTVPCARFGDVQQYRLQLESDNDNIVGLDAIEDELRTAGLNLRVEAVENILNTLCGVIPEYIARTGNAIRLGNLVTLKPYATGTVAHANDAPDPEKNHLEVRATVCPALRYSLAKARLVNAMRNVDGIDSFWAVLNRITERSTRRTILWSLGGTSIFQNQRAMQKFGGARGLRPEKAKSWGGAK